MQIKTVAMIGIGSIGAYLAPRLMQAVGRENFRAVAEGARKQRMDTEGFTINGEVYHFPTVTPEVRDPADLVVVAVKSTALDAAIAQIGGQVGENTVILSVLNGVTSEQQIAAAYGEDKLLYSLMRVSAMMDEAHAINYDPQKGAIFFGEKDNATLSPRVQAVKDLFERAQIPYKIPEDMIHDMWYKFMANVGENLTTALLGLPFGAFQVSEHANAIRVAAMREVSAVAQRLGIDVGEKEIARQEKVLQGLPFPNKSSTFQDIEAGRRTEIELFAGQMIKFGKELGIPTPYNELFYHAIRVLEEKNDGMFNR